MNEMKTTNVAMDEIGHLHEAYEKDSVSGVRNSVARLASANVYANAAAS